MIAVNHLTKSFGNHVVLDDITESIETGEKVVIIGPSGSGKSTFLRCLNCVMTEDGKLIEIQGTGEGRAFSLDEQQELVRLCAKGIGELNAIQKELVGDVL